MFVSTGKVAAPLRQQRCSCKHKPRRPIRPSWGAMQSRSQCGQGLGWCRAFWVSLARHLDSSTPHLQAATRCSAGASCLSRICWPEVSFCWRKSDASHPVHTMLKLAQVYPHAANHRQQHQERCQCGCGRPAAARLGFHPNAGIEKITQTVWAERRCVFQMPFMLDRGGANVPETPAK